MQAIVTFRKYRIQLEPGSAGRALVRRYLCAFVLRSPSADRRYSRPRANRARVASTRSLPHRCVGVTRSNPRRIPSVSATSPTQSNVAEGLSAILRKSSSSLAAFFFFGYNQLILGRDYAPDSNPFDAAGSRRARSAGDRWQFETRTTLTARRPASDQYPENGAGEWGGPSFDEIARRPRLRHLPSGFGEALGARRSSGGTHGLSAFLHCQRASSSPMAWLPIRPSDTASKRSEPLEASRASSGSHRVAHLERVFSTQHAWIAPSSRPSWSDPVRMPHFSTRE